MGCGGFVRMIGDCVAIVGVLVEGRESEVEVLRIVGDRVRLL